MVPAEEVAEGVVLFLDCERGRVRHLRVIRDRHSKIS